MLKTNAPSEIRSQVEMQSFTTAKELEETISGYVVSQLAAKGKDAGQAPSGFGAAADTTAMDVDMRGKKGQKGKERGKSKDKSDGKQNKDGKKVGLARHPRDGATIVTSWVTKRSSVGTPSKLPWPR